MGSTLTTRISDELKEEIEAISEEEHLDVSAVTRRLLERAVEEHRLERALERYGEGELSLGRAAAEAGVPLRVFLRELKGRGVPFHYSGEDLEEDFEAATDV